jgi:hypothetical protein
MLALLGCSVATTGPSHVPFSPAAGVVLDADPNPVTTGLGLGTTTISWSIADGDYGQVYVSEAGGAETLFNQGQGAGQAVAGWIKSDSSYAFTLYRGVDRTQLLGSLVVTRK